MELFKLLGTIAIDNSGANKALDETSNKGEKTQSKLSKSFGAIGKGALAVGTTIASGLAVGATAFAGLAAKALSASGELEQNMGGSEAVFKQYAGKMQETAKSAFSQMGLSTSDYLATANKMGALFQGAGFDIKESMDLSSSAMQRAADVASIMGIDTGSAMEAIAGAAKGNFTMMDNLGVAMNDTTIQAYALSKGIDKSTSEMTNQEKIGLAMEMFMEKTAYAAGNYAKENETLAGSLGTAKAALTNFLDGSGSVDDLVSSFENLANVGVRSLEEILPRLTTGLTEIVNQAIPKIPPLLQKLLPSIVDGAVSLLNGVVSALPSVLDILISTLIPELLSAIVTVFEALVSALPLLISTLTSALPVLIPRILEAAISMVITLVQQLPSIIKPILDILPSLLTSIVLALVDNLPILVEAVLMAVALILEMYPMVVLELVKALPSLLVSLLKMIVELLPILVVGIFNALVSLFTSVFKGWAGAFEFAWDLLQSLFGGMKDFFSPLADWFNTNVIQPVANYFRDLWDKMKSIWDGICNAVSIAIQLIAAILNAAFQIITLPFRFIWENCKDIILNAWNAIREKVSTAINAIKKVITVVFDAVKLYFTTVFNVYKTIFTTAFNVIRNTVSTVFNAIKTVVMTVFNAVKTYFTTVLNFYKNLFTTIWNAIRNTISKVVNGIKNTITNVFNSVKNTVGNIFNSIREKMSKPIEKARDTIKGIVDRIKGFFSGMKLKFPNIKLPHFGISPSGWKIGDLLKGSIPKLKIDWYAKAMNDPMILTRPTIFGYNGATGELMGGGEAGNEVVSGANTLMQMIQSAVSAQNETLVYYLQTMVAMLADYFPQILDGMDRPISFDPNRAAVALAGPMNRELGKISARKDRGR